MNDTPRTDAVCKCAIGQQLERELAEAVNQIKLAQKGYDYIGACEDARHYKEVAAALREELAEAKRERDKHFAASKAQNEDITSLQAELAACRVDAGRYRWLRDMNNDDAAMRCVQLCGAAMDEAIDEAIKGSAK